MTSDLVNLTQSNGVPLFRGSFHCRMTRGTEPNLLSRLCGVDCWEFGLPNTVSNVYYFQTESWLSHLLAVPHLSIIPVIASSSSIYQAFRLSPSLTPSDDSLLLCLVTAPFSLPFYIYNHSWPDTIPLKMTMIDMGMDTAWCLACSKQLVSALEKKHTKWSC